VLPLTYSLQVAILQIEENQFQIKNCPAVFPLLSDTNHEQPVESVSLLNVSIWKKKGL